MTEFQRRTAEPIRRREGETRAEQAGARQRAQLLSDVNGTPVFLQLLLAVFDGGGVLRLSGVVPPELSGNAMTFLALGIAPTGKVESTNPEVVTFQ